MISIKLKILPKAIANAVKNPPERFWIKAFDTAASDTSEKSLERVLTMSLAPEKASFWKKFRNATPGIYAEIKLEKL